MTNSQTPSAAKMTSSSSAAPAGALALAHQALVALRRDAHELGHAMARAVRAEVPAIAAAADKEAGLIERLGWMSEQSVLTLVTVTLDSREPTEHELAFVQELAIRRAADAFPLDPLLHGLRVGQRVIWQHFVRELADAPDAAKALVLLTEQTLRYTDTLSTTLAATYVRTQQARAADHERRRTEILEEVLSGRFPYRQDTPARIAAFGLDPEEQCVVIVAVECDTRNPSDPLTRERIKNALERHVHRLGAHALVAERDSDVIAVVAPAIKARALAASALEDLVGGDEPSIAIGLSGTCPRLADASRGQIEAIHAVAAVRHTGGVVALNEIRLIDYLVVRADTTARRLLDHAAPGLAASTSKPLLETLFAYLDSDLSVPATAARLSIHPNTVRYRLAKLEQLTKLDTRSFWDLAELAAAAKILARHSPPVPSLT